MKIKFSLLVLLFFSSLCYSQFDNGNKALQISPIKNTKISKPKPSTSKFSPVSPITPNFKDVPVIKEPEIIFQKIGQYSFKGSFDGWLKRVMINNVLQQYRQQTLLSLVNEDVAEDCEVELDDDDISLDYLLKIIQELPDRYRLVFNLYVIDGFSHAEIAEMLNINIGTSKSNLARGRMILKDKIEQLKNEETKKIPSAK